MVQVPPHQVRAAQINFLVAGVVEIVNALFQEPADDAGHANVFADTFDARQQAADARTEDPRARRPASVIQQPDHPGSSSAFALKSGALPGPSWRDGFPAGSIPPAAAAD